MPDYLQLATKLDKIRFDGTLNVAGQLQGCSAQQDTFGQWAALRQLLEPPEGDASLERYLEGFPLRFFAKVPKSKEFSLQSHSKSQSQLNFQYYLASHTERQGASTNR